MLEHLVHMVHWMGEHNEHIAVYANTLFGISLSYGGIHFAVVQLRDRRHQKMKRMASQHPSNHVSTKAPHNRRANHYHHHR